MSDVKIEQLPKNAVKITVTVPHTDLLPFLEEAAQHISEHSSIPGFRLGKASYEVIKNRVGEMKIYEEALEPVVRKTFLEAVLSNEIQTVGSPKIDVEKLAPGNDLIYTAEVALMPKVTKLAEIKDIKVETKTIEVPQKEVDAALEDLRRMRTREIRETSGTTVDQKKKVVVAMNMKKGGVNIEGGQSPNHAIYLQEEYYIPGLTDQLLGMTEGEQKAFSLSFPKEHPQKMLAGEQIEFEITLKEIYRLEPPTLDDAFAKELGQTDLSNLKGLLEKNIRAEKEEEERLRFERVMLEEIARTSRFENFPDLLVNEEINKMVSELQQAVESQGLNFETYLSNLKKPLSEMKLDFTPQAITRIKVALILTQVAKQESIKVSGEELKKELDTIAERYEDAETKKRVFAPMHREYVETILRNRKTIEFLKSSVLKREV